ncbi:electron transfer flavoprotein subunit beta/FixA family protein [Paenibacillus antri]|uniref:Electron transfer flavoprotein subunit beta n=1 Tax=Paenibacillus antri TaxID=2582848 RepID=A0A5R9GCP8_9BACL|nr:electron transfer flavoprotein subunit beta/FixA family protein [Paenibacillus antri]TLS52096.1 electron transfer flavoprotein subunit beta/FixA family protein [Paenibacillus antri]
MNIVVLVKQTFDTEERIVLTDGVVSEDGAKFVINPYDEYAVEQGILMRDAAGGGKVTVLSVGPARVAEALRTALAMGADEAVLIDDPRIGNDEHAVSIALAAALGGAGGAGAPTLGGAPVDVLLGGNFSVDNGAGQVAVRLAALLGVPHVASVTALEASGGAARAERDAEGDVEVVEVPLPALFTAQQGLNEPRYPSLPGIMKAKKKPFATLTLDDLGLSPDDVAPKTTRVGLALPPARAAGRLLAGDPAAQAAELARLLRDEAKVL